MSERGSFVTEYIYCEKCFEVVRRILIAHSIMPTTIRGTIIAGIIGGLHSGEELEIFECFLIPDIEKEICHPIRIAVLAEEGKKIFTAIPNADHPKRYKSSFEKSKEHLYNKNVIDKLNQHIFELEKSLKLQERLLEIDNKIIDERNKLHSAIPECPVHGCECVPHAIEWVNRVKAFGKTIKE